MPPKLLIKPTVTILYDAEEERVREQALAKGEKFPNLVSQQIEEVLTKRGYTVKKLAAVTPIKRLVRLLEDDNSELIFNVCESLGGEGGEERRIASMLELLDKRFTGSGSLALTLAGDKSLAKKLFDFHDISSPDFTIIAPGHVEGSMVKLNSFPLIVKPIATDASIGINAKSVVYSVQEMMDRVFSIHQEFHTPALVEQYIDGREIYLGLIGNPPSMLTPIEWDLSKLPDGMPRIAGSEVKWDDGKNPELKAAKEFVPEDVLQNVELMGKLANVAMSAWKALQIRDYARIDIRLTDKGTPFVIEVNPNPWLDKSAEFALAARRTKPELSYGDLIERIIEISMDRPMRNGRPK